MNSIQVFKKYRIPGTNISLFNSFKALIAIEILLMSTHFPMFIQAQYAPIKFPTIQPEQGHLKRTEKETVSPTT